MRKIPSVFKRDYKGDRRVYDEVVPGCEWVLAGEGQATAKWDGTCCRVDDNGRLWKRYDRRLTRTARKKDAAALEESDFKPAPDGWVAAEESPNLHTGHWPGWLLVGDGPEDKWHREGLAAGHDGPGTYELVGPKVNANRHGLERHALIAHGADVVPMPPTLTFDLIRYAAEGLVLQEGIVWHHPDGRMAKIKRRDFGFPWPAESQTVTS